MATGSIIINRKDDIQGGANIKPTYIRRSVWGSEELSHGGVNGTIHYYDGKSGPPGEPFNILDVVENTVSSETKLFICIKTHDLVRGIWSINTDDTTYWKEIEKNDIGYFKKLIADSANINNITVKELLFGNSGNKGRLTTEYQKHGNFVLWFGGHSPESSNFSVDADGNLYCNNVINFIRPTTYINVGVGGSIKYKNKYNDSSSSVDYNNKSFIQIKPDGLVINERTGQISKNSLLYQINANSNTLIVNITQDNYSSREIEFYVSTSDGKVTFISTSSGSYESDIANIDNGIYVRDRKCKIFEVSSPTIVKLKHIYVSNEHRLQLVNTEDFNIVHDGFGSVEVRSLRGGESSDNKSRYNFSCLGFETSSYSSSNEQLKIIRNSGFENVNVGTIDYASDILIIKNKANGSDRRSSDESYAKMSKGTHPQAKPTGILFAAGQNNKYYCIINLFKTNIQFSYVATYNDKIPQIENDSLGFIDSFVPDFTKYTDISDGSNAYEEIDEAILNLYEKVIISDISLKDSDGNHRQFSSSNVYMGLFRNTSCIIIEMDNITYDRINSLYFKIDIQ